MQKDSNCVQNSPLKTETKIKPRWSAGAFAEFVYRTHLYKTNAIAIWFNLTGGERPPNQYWLAPISELLNMQSKRFKTRPYEAQFVKRIPTVRTTNG